MATTNFNNRLITPELTEALSSYPLYSQDAKKKDALCIAVFYLGNIRWYIMEGQQEGNDFTLYGIVTGTSLLPKWQVSPMTQVSMDLAH